jgi:cell division protein FtsA
MTDAFGVIDLGASRTLAMIAAPDASGQLRLAGIGALAQSDNDDPARSIKLALARAEQMAGQVLDTVALVCGHASLASRRAAAACHITGEAAGEADARAALNAAAIAGQTPQRKRLSVAAMGYQVDDGPVCADPRGRPGATITAHANIVSVADAEIARVRDLLDEIGLSLVGVAAGPQAAALAVTSAEARDSGAITLDIGAAGIGLAIHVGGGLAHCEVLPGGGAAVTAALARRLGAPEAVAERAKLIFGGFQPGAARFVDIPRIGADGRLDVTATTRADIAEPIAEALDAQFSAVRAAIMRHAPVAFVERWPVAITGGGGELAGIEVLAASAIGLPVHVARIGAFPELSHGAASGSVSAAAGGLLLLGARHAQRPGDRRLQSRRTTPLRAFAAPVSPALVGKMAHRAWEWLRTNF